MWLLKPLVDKKTNKKNFTNNESLFKLEGFYVTEICQIHTQKCVIFPSKNYIYILKRPCEMCVYIYGMVFNVTQD